MPRSSNSSLSPASASQHRQSRYFFSEAQYKYASIKSAPTSSECSAKALYRVRWPEFLRENRKRTIESRKGEAFPRLMCFPTVSQRYPRREPSAEHRSNRLQKDQCLYFSIESHFRQACLFNRHDEYRRASTQLVDRWEISSTTHSSHKWNGSCASPYCTGKLAFCCEAKDK